MLKKVILSLFLIFLCSNSESFTLTLTDTGCANYQTNVDQFGNVMINCAGQPVPVPTPTPNPTPSGTAVCQGFTNTKTVVMPWNSAKGNFVSPTTTNFDSETAYVYEFTTPKQGNNRVGLVSFYFVQGNDFPRIVYLSTLPCGKGNVIGNTEGTTAPLYFTVGGSILSYPALSLNTTYYFSVFNKKPGQSCQGYCDGRMEFSFPKGL